MNFCYEYIYFNVNNVDIVAVAILLSIFTIFLSSYLNFGERLSSVINPLTEINHQNVYFNIK